MELEFDFSLGIEIAARITKRGRVKADIFFLFCFVVLNTNRGTWRRLYDCVETRQLVVWRRKDIFPHENKRSTCTEISIVSFDILGWTFSIRLLGDSWRCTLYQRIFSRRFRISSSTVF